MSNQGRRWVGDEARDSSLDTERTWVIWGRGPVTPASLADASEGDEIAEGMARGEDASWDGLPRADRWIVLVHGHEADVDELVAEESSAMGYAPYLADGLEQGDRVTRRPPMRGVLRGDVAPRRKVSQPRPS